MNKKQRKILIGVLIIVGFAIIALYGKEFSLLWGGTEVDCNEATSDTWSCGMVRGQYIAAENGKFTLYGHYPWNIGGLTQSWVCSKISALTDEVCRGPNPGEPASAYRNYVAGMHNRLLKPELMILEGTFEGAGKSGNFKTYGFCDVLDRPKFCEIYEPVLEGVTEEEMRTINLNPTSMKIHFKKNGWEGENICVETGIEKCEGRTLYVCEDFKLVNKGEVTGKCGVEERRTYYRLSENTCIEVSIYPSQKTAKDYETLEECKANIPPVPPKPKPFWSKIIDTIINWIKKIFDFFFTIAGPTEVELGSTQTYTTELILTTPVDSDYSDGQYSVRWGSMALVDKDGRVIKEKEWKEIGTTYTDTLTIIVPQNLDKHAIISTIVEINGTYNFQTKQWEFDDGIAIEKEGISLKTKLPAPVPPKPIWESLINLLKKLWDWLSGLFK